MKRKSDEFVMPGCVGTLISETFVLTAAICTQSLGMIAISIYLNDAKISSTVISILFYRKGYSLERYPKYYALQ